MRDSDEGSVRRIEPERSLKTARLTADVRAQVVELCAGYRRRPPSGPKGTIALFAGPAGTGKTEAAEALAGELGLDLYRVDLSRVVSKYIGETEKNLDRIFAQAEAAEAVLFFDEADALFGKRSEVKDAHDRYANAGVGHLLERIESYPGIVILATNLPERIDESLLQAARTISFRDEPD